MKKRITSLLLALSLVATMMVAGAMPASAKVANGIALGDNITTGYGLDGYVESPMPMAKESYISLISSKLHMPIVNYAEDGLTSAGLLDQLQKAEGGVHEWILKADNIFITIGQNDLQRPLLDKLAVALGLDMTSPSAVEEMWDALNKAMAGDEELMAKVIDTLMSYYQSIPQIMEDFEKNLGDILDALAILNPDAKVILQTMPNPIAADQPIFGEADKLFGDMNDVIAAQHATRKQVRLADVNAVFDGFEGVLFNPEKLGVPNATGHKLISYVVETQLIPENAFTDVQGHWAEYAIGYGAENGFMLGTAEDAFSPNEVMKRGMLVTVLGRMSGVDATTYEDCGFTDVNEDAYYHVYLNWAVAEGIVKGVTEDTFQPENPVQRQDMATILDRYVSYMEYEYAVPADPEAAFDDADTIRGYAKDAVQILKDNEIFNGKDGNNFMPTEFGTRAEFATVLFRFDFNVVGYNQMLNESKIG